MKNYIILVFTLLTQCLFAQINDFNNVLWVKNIAGYGLNELVTQTNSVNAVYGCTDYEACPTCFFSIAGANVHANNDGHSRVLFFKFDSNGNFMMADSIYNPSGTTTLIDFKIDHNDNLVFFINSTTSFLYKGISINAGYTIIKLDPNLNYLWSQQIEGSYHVPMWIIKSQQLVIDQLNNIFISGSVDSDTLKISNFTYVRSFGSTHNFFLSKIDQAGLHQWTRVFETPTAFFNAPALNYDNSGNIIAFGTFTQNWINGQDTINWQGPSANGFIIKLDAYGNKLWLKSNFDDIISGSVVMDNQNNVIIAGYFDVHTSYAGYNFNSNGAASDYIIAKFDSSGDILWSTSFGTIYSNGIPVSVAIDSMNNIFIAGHENTCPTLIKLDSQGNYILDFDPDLIFNNHEGYYVTFDNAGKLIHSGSFSGTIIFGNYTITGGISSMDKFIVKFDETTSLNNLQSNDVSDLIISPSPAKNFINVKLKSHSLLKGQLNLCNAYGQILKNIDINTSKTSPVYINIHDLAPGIYFIKWSDNGSNKIQKFVKN